jgi:hypothetical protein
MIRWTSGSICKPFCGMCLFFAEIMAVILNIIKKNIMGWEYLSSVPCDGGYIHR